MNTAPDVRAAVMVLTMVAMMLPSFAPTLWRYHQASRASHPPRAGRQTSMFALGYLGAWAVLSLVLAVLSGELSQSAMDGMASPSSFAHLPWAVAAVVLGAGALQCSTWKAAQLRHCRERFSVARGVVSQSLIAAWTDGYRFGARCVVSCAPITAVSFAIGMMDGRAMALATIVVFAERVSPNGILVARLSGVATLMVGIALCAVAIASR